MDISNLPKINKMLFLQSTSMYMLYYCIVFILIIVIILLPIVKVKVSVKTAGLLRPLIERTEVKATSTGIVQSIYFKEGDYINKGQLLMQISQQHLPEKSINSNIEIQRCKENIADLILLTSGENDYNIILQQLHLPIYQQQASKFIQQSKALEVTLNKLSVEWKIDSALFLDKVISKKELFDKKSENDQQISNFIAFKHEQIVAWQKELLQYNLQLEAAKKTNLQFQEEIGFTKIYAPVSGVIQQLTAKYSGSYITSAEQICLISPETDLIAECFVSPKDIGMVYKGQEAILQIDAFNHHQFGTVKAKLISIDNDYLVINNKPVFKIRCLLYKSSLSLKSGFKGILKKGFTIQARLTIAERTLWQLLSDSVNDWLDPSASPIT